MRNLDRMANVLHCESSASDAKLIWTLRVERAVAGGMNGKQAMGRSG